VRILTDDQDMSSLPVMTKTMNLLAANGVTYNNSVVSLSLCCAARATLLTGQYAHNHHVWDNGGLTSGYLHFDNADNSLAPWLQQAGYQTSHVGKYMNAYGKDHAKEVPKGGTTGSTSLTRTASLTRTTATRSRTTANPTKYGTADSDYITDVFADRAVADVKKMAASNQPFFLDYWPTAPHSGNGRSPPSTSLRCRGRSTRTPTRGPRRRVARTSCPRSTTSRSRSSPSPTSPGRQRRQRDVPRVDRRQLPRLAQLAALG